MRSRAGQGSFVEKNPGKKQPGRRRRKVRFVQGGLSATPHSAPLLLLSPAGLNGGPLGYGRGTGAGRRGRRPLRHMPKVSCRGRPLGGPCRLAIGARPSKRRINLVAACWHRVKRNYSQVLPGHMPRGGSRSCSGAGRYGLQQLSGFANQHTPYRRPDVLRGPRGRQ